MVDLGEYVAGGYFLSRFVGPRDCTGTQLRRVSMAHDHSSRVFFPDSWTLSWCGSAQSDRASTAAIFGVAEHDLDAVVAWADNSFDRAFGPWSVCFTLTDARAIARSFLTAAPDLELWGLGLHRTLVRDRDGKTKANEAPLATGGTKLGYEILIAEHDAFDSPESRHLDETEMFAAVDVTPNEHGLIDSLDDAIACSEFLDRNAPNTPHQIIGWRPWLLLRYSI